MSIVDSFTSFLISQGYQPEVSFVEGTDIFFGYEVQLETIKFIYKIESLNEIFIPRIFSTNQNIGNGLVKWMRLIKKFEKENNEFAKLTGIVLLDSNVDSEKLVQIYKKMGAKTQLNNVGDYMIEYNFEDYTQ